MGLVPREHSTGGKQRLLGSSKQGNSYLRRLFVQFARSILRFREKQGAPFGVWLAQLMSRSPQNVVVVALANELVRTAWAVLFKQRTIPQPDANSRLTAIRIEMEILARSAGGLRRWHNGRTGAF